MNYDWLTDIRVFQVNRLENKAYKHQYSSEAELLAKETSFQRSLNGTWKFEYATSVAACNKDFYKMDYDCSAWDTIRVPGHFSLQGYGKSYYLNHVYPWSGGAQDLLPGQVPDVNDVGSYITTFDLSVEDLQERIEICFDGVESAFALWVNGIFIGYSEDSYDPSCFDLSDAVKVGTNKLAVQVFRFCSGSWLEDQDYFRMCGIFRDVNLALIPKTHLLDLRVVTPLYDHYQKATVNIDCEFEGCFENAIASFKLLDKNMELVAETTDSIRERLSVSFKVENPDLWSSEYPNLYTLQIRVILDGEILEITQQRVGIREFKIIGNVMHINGKRIVFHGVNRHEFNAKTGRVIPYEITLEDIKLMKANNINALRTSHYPNSEYLYELCDEYGLYCCCEANVETHGTWNEWWNMEQVIPHNKMEWLDAVIDRANSMYQRDKNHASIVMWSLGNESFGGRVLYEESEFLRKMDPTRVIHYEGLEYEELYSKTREYPDTSDMESQMYTPVAKIEEFLKKHSGKPFVLCEYSHSMGNSNGGLYKYTELERKYPEYQGGFIWDWIDQGQYDETGVIRYGGDLRERPSDYDFCGNGLLFADRRITPKMTEVKYCFQYVDMNINPEKIEITNNYLFTNLNTFTCTLELNKAGVQIEKKKYILNCEPLTSIELDNPFQVTQKDQSYDVIMRIFNTEGHEVAHQQYIYEQEKATAPNCNIEIKYSEDFLNIGLKAGAYHLIFSKTKGLVCYEVNGEQMLRQAPRPNFFRARTSNDCNNGHGIRYGQWLLASMYTEPHFIKVEKGTTLCKVYYEYALPSLGDNRVSVIYTITGDGKIRVDMNYTPCEKNTPMPAFGMLFTFYKEYDSVKYFGFGPEENYIDRNMGSLLGFYGYKVKDNLTPYYVPQECGNRTNTQFVSIESPTTNHQITFTSECFEFSALPYTPFELENALHQDELPNCYQTVVCLYSKQMGVGGDDSWGSEPQDEYLLSNSKPQHLHFTFIGDGNK